MTSALNTKRNFLILLTNHLDTYQTENRSLIVEKIINYSYMILTYCFLSNNNLQELVLNECGLEKNAPFQNKVNQWPQVNQVYQLCLFCDGV